MTRKQERIIAALILLWCSFWCVSFLQAREAKARVLEMDRVEVEVYEALWRVDGVYSEAKEKTERAFSFVVDQ